MKQYLELLEDILENGEEKLDRTGVGTIGVTFRSMRFDLSKGFPAMTTKKLFFKGVAEELFWFLRGSSNVKELQDVGVHIWDDWVLPDGTIGPGYGYQWRSFAGTEDQIEKLVDGLKNNPSSRRHLVSAWDISEISHMALPPCHYAFQFIVRGNKLDCIFHMRSVDVFLGLPFNVASYALLTHLIAAECGFEVGELVWTGGDVHIYKNHIEQVKLQLTRQPMHLPDLTIVNQKSVLKANDGYCFEDVRLVGYLYYPAIKAPVAV